MVGAGPAGTAAAIRAQDRGLHVEVVDRATFPRDKTCGDGLTTAALRHLERLGVPRRSLSGMVPIHETILVSPSGRRVTLSFPDHGLYAGVIAREELDAVLVEFARSRGVAVHEGTPVVNVTNEASSVAVSCADGSHFEASYVVAADGNYSTVRRILEPTGERRLGTSHAFRQYFRGVEDPRLWVVFEPDLLPGYAWVFPLPGGRANVGFGVRRTSATSGKQLNALWRDLMRRPSIREILGAGEPEGAPRAWPIPGDLDAAALSDGRLLYVGDAAGTVDPLTGEGIAQAIETGILAADSVADSVAAPPLMGLRRVSPNAMNGLWERRFAPTPAWPRRCSASSPLRCSPGPPCERSTRPSGPDATSRGGCSRTIPERSSSHPVDGTGAHCRAQAPTEPESGAHHLVAIR